MQSAAARPGASSAAAKTTTGCYKCGKTGHWSRDCTAPSDEWINKTGGGAARATDAQPAATAENDPASEPAALGAAAAAKQKRKRPKVTLELLKQPSGLPEVYHNFPTICAQQFRGPGHEVADLRRLLEMYKRWQDRIFPGVEFDRFVVDVEKLSGSNVLKHELQDMRVSLLKAAQDAAAPVPAEPEDDAAEAGGGAAVEEMEDDLLLDDDELMEMAAQPVESSLAAAAMLSMPDDDELMELALCSQEQEPQLAGVGAGDAADDDADLLELAEFGEDEEAAGLDLQLAPEVAGEDEELLALAVQGALQPDAQEPEHKDAEQSAAAPAPAMGVLGGAAASAGDEAQPSAAGTADEDDDDDVLLQLAMGGSQD